MSLLDIVLEFILVLWRIERTKRVDTRTNIEIIVECYSGVILKVGDYG